MKAINELVRKHTAFPGAVTLIKSALRHPYRLTTLAECPEMKRIADFYDAAMEKRGIEKRAYRIHA